MFKQLLWRFLEVILWGGVVIFAYRPLSTAWARNQWSLSFLAALDSPSQMALGTVSLPPSSHIGAPAWMGAQALARHHLEWLTPSWVDLLRLHSDWPSDALVLGYWYYEHGKIDIAREVWIKNALYYPLYRAVAEAIDQGKSQWAEETLWQMVEVDPAGSVSRLANLLLHQKRYEKAAEVLVASLQAYPSSNKTTEWWVRLGDIYRNNLKQCNRAQEAYQQALQTHLSVYWVMRAQIGLGWCAYKEGEEAKAVHWFQQAITSNPTAGDGYLAMAQLLVKEKREEEAELWFKQAVTRNPQARWWWLLWADARRSAEPPDLQGAIALYQEIVNRFPDWNVGYEHLAAALHEEGKDLAAAAAMQKAIALKDHPTAYDWFHLGSLLEAAGHTSEAVRAYQKALEIDPRYTAALQALKRLNGKP